MIKLWFRLPWLWLKRDILLLYLHGFPDPHPAGSPGTGLYGARADLSDISRKTVFGSLWIFFSFFSLGRSCIQTAVQLHKPLVARKEGVSGRQEWGARGQERKELSLLPHHWKAGTFCSSALIQSSASSSYKVPSLLWKEYFLNTCNIFQWDSENFFCLCNYLNPSQNQN